MASPASVRLTNACSPPVALREGSKISGSAVMVAWTLFESRLSWLDRNDDKLRRENSKIKNAFADKRSPPEPIPIPGSRSSMRLRSSQSRVAQCRDAEGNVRVARNASPSRSARAHQSSLIRPCNSLFHLLLARGPRKGTRTGLQKIKSTQLGLREDFIALTNIFRLPLPDAQAERTE